MRRVVRSGIVLLVAMAASHGSSAWAAPGDLDPGFGAGGTVTTSIGAGADRAVAVAVQPTDGKIIVVGYTFNGTSDDWAIVRYNTNGTPDGGFGTGGVVTTSFGSGTDHAHAVAIQPSDGKIVVGGYTFNGTDTDFALARYNADGTLDIGFGSSGKVTTAVGSFDDEINGLAIDASGKIVVAGQSSDGTYNRFALARYNTNGTLDGTFGSGGKVTTDILAGSDAANAIAIQPTDGKIVAAGRANNLLNRDFAVARYNANGSLDGTFGSGGLKTTPIGPGDDTANAVAIQPTDGKIVAAGVSNNATNADFAVVRYNTAGSLDTSFGAGGKVTTNIGHDDAAFGVAIQPSDGKIVLAGTAASFYFAVARYTAGGSLDAGFGTGGVVTTALSFAGSDGSALALQSDGDIVVAGDAYGSDYDFAAARYLVGAATPSYQPDEAIKLPKKPYVGDNTYNVTATNQTVLAKVARGRSKTFTVRVENDGSVSDSFTLQGPGGQPGFRVRYLQGTTLVTSQIVGGTYSTGSLGPGAFVTLRISVTVKSTATVGVTDSWLVVATSATSTSQQDAVKARVKATA